MNDHILMMMDQYEAKRDFYEILKDEVLRLLSDLTDRSDMVVSQVEGRVKTAESLLGKLELKGEKYRTIEDITDIVGCRIITYYCDEVDRISALLESLFQIDWENSVDKRKMLKENQFGYMSLHYVCRIPETVCSHPDYPELNSIRFEVQIRTALQHVWANMYHDVGYKTDVEVPNEYLRMLSRLAGLLEIADEEFRYVRDNLEEYRGRLRKLFRDGKLEDIELNGDSFHTYLELKPFDALTQKIASINRAEIQPVNIFRNLEILQKIGMKTLGDVEQLRKDNEEEAYRLAKYQLAGKDIDIVSESIGIQNLCIVYLLKKGQGAISLKALLDFRHGQREANERFAERIVVHAREAGIIR